MNKVNRGYEYKERSGNGITDIDEVSERIGYEQGE